MLDTLFASRFTDTQGKSLCLGCIGAGIHVTVDDEDDPGNPNDKVSVTVLDPLSGDAEQLSLAKLTVGGYFRNRAPLPSASGAAVPGNGILETSPDATSNVRYVDDDYPRDQSLSRLRIRLTP